MAKVEIELSTLITLIAVAEEQLDMWEADGSEGPPVLVAAVDEANKLAYPNLPSR